jgi:hypothetical protein
MTSQPGQLTTKGLTEATRAIVQPLLPQSFRYLRSKSEFCAPFNGGMSLIAIRATSPRRGVCSLAFNLAVSHHGIERCIREILGEEPSSEYGHSIWCYTVNIGPLSPHWTHRIPGSWLFADPAEVTAAEPQIREFLSEIALPYVLEHQDPVAIRRTLLEQPGHAQSLAPYRQILAVDRQLGLQTQATEDLATLEACYARFFEGYRREFQAFRERFLLQ